MKANKVPSERYTRTNGVIVEVYNRMEAALTKTKLTPDTVVYHGTAATFDKFALIKRNPTTPVDEVNAFFFTTDPRVAYGHARRMAKDSGGKIRIIAAKLKFKTLQDVTSRVKRYQREIGNFGKAKRKAYAEVDSTKVDGIEFRGDSVNTPEYVIFNPDIIEVLDHGWTERKLVASYVKPAHKTKILKNPSTQTVLNLINNAQYRELKGLIVKNDVYIWNNVEEWHHGQQAIKAGLIDPPEKAGGSAYQKIRDFDDMRLTFMFEMDKGNEERLVIVNASKELEAIVKVPYLRKLINEADLYLDGDDPEKDFAFIRGQDYMKESELQASLKGVPEDIVIEDKGIQEALKRGALDFIAVPTQSYHGSIQLEIVPKDLGAAKEYVARHGNGKTAYYDPELAELHDEDADDPIMHRTYAKPRKEVITEIPDYGPGHMYRGIGLEEYQEFQRTGEVKSLGSHNIGDAQKGLTYWTTEYNTAMSYANGFAPWYYKPTFKHPCFVLVAKKVKPEDTRHVAGVGGHEIGVTRPIKKSEIGHIWCGVVFAMDKGSMDIRPRDYEEKNYRMGSFFGGSTQVAWQKIDRNLKITAADKKPYGYWFTHTGERVEVKPYEHDIMAARIILKNYNEQYTAFNKSGRENYKVAAFKLFGWIRVVNESDGVSVEAWPDNVAPKAFDAFSKHIKNEVFDHIILGWARSGNSGYIQEKDNKCERILRALYKARPVFNREDKDIITVESEDQYGYWITDAGEMLPVEFQSHNTVAEKYIVKNLYNEYFNFIMEIDVQDFNIFCLYKGWIRTLTTRDTINVQILKDRVAPSALRSLTRYIEREGFARIRIDVSRRSGNEFLHAEYKGFDLESGNDRRQASSFMRSQLQKNLEASLIPYGYWVTPKGELLEVANGAEGHISALKKYMKTNDLKLPEIQYNMIFPNENYAPLFNRGWIRLIRSLGDETYDINMLHNSLYPRSINTLVRFLKDYPGKIEVDFINTPEDEWLTFDKRSQLVEFLKKNTRKDTSLEAATKSEVYGYWITDEGELLIIKDENVGHIDTFKKYIKRENKQSEYTKDDIDTIEDLEYWPVLTRGWIRIVFEGYNQMNTEIFRKRVSSKAFSKFKSLLASLNVNQMFLDINIDKSISNIDFESFDKKHALVKALEQNVVKELTAADTKGFWINSDGKLIEFTEGATEHYEEAEKYFDGFGYAALYKALDSGWIRARTFGTTLIVTIGVDSLPDKAIKSFMRYLKENYFEKIEMAVHKNIHPVKYIETEGDTKGLNTVYRLLKDNSYKAPVVNYDEVDKLLKELEASTSEPYFSQKALRRANEEADSPKSRTTLIMIKPSDFLKMAEPAFSKEKYEKAKQLNKDRVQYNDVPFLIFENNGDTTATVVGHEGRHRSMILKELGDKPMPVAFKSSGGKGGSIRWGSQDGFDKIDVWPETLIGEGNNSGNRMAFPDSEYYPRGKKMEALDESDNTFEAWITDKGVIASPISHMRTLKIIMAKYKTLFERLNIFKRDNSFSSNAEAYAFGTRQLGFIRVVGSEKAPSIMFAKDSVNPEVYRLFSKYFRDRVEPTTLVFTDALEFPYEEDNLGATVEFKEFRQQAPLFAWVRANVKKTNLEAAEKWDSNAWWVTNEGKVIEVGAEKEHGEFAQPVFDKNKEKHIRHSTETAIANGWVRLRKDSNYMYVIVQQNKLSLAAYAAVLKLLNNQIYDNINLETFGKQDTYEEYTNTAKFSRAFKLNLAKDKEMKTIVAIDGDNNVEWVSKEEILETWRTDNKNERIDLVQRKSGYLVREFDPEGELTQESVYKFKETASDYLLQTVREKQNANVFYSKQSNLNMEAADLEQFIERWESVDGKYATTLGKGEFGYFIKDYVKNQIDQTFRYAAQSSLGRKTFEESETEFKKHLTMLQKSGTRYKKVDATKSFVTPKESRKLADAQVKVRGSAEAKGLDGFKPFSKQPALPGLQVVTKKTGSFIYAKVLHKDSGLTLVNITNKPLGFSPSELVARIDNSDLSAFDWTLPSKELFNRYGNNELLQAARKFYDSLSENMKDKTDKELEGILQNMVKDYIISKLTGFPKRAKNTRQRIDAVIKAKDLDAAKVYNYFGDVDDRTKAARDQVLKNVGLTRSTAGGYDLIKNTAKPASAPVAAKPKPIPDKIATRIASQRSAREAAQSDKIIMPPKTGTASDSMVGHYVVGLDGKNELRGIVLKQVRDKRTGRSSGQVVVLTNDSDPSSYNVYTLNNLKRTLKKPPKALISAFNIVSARNRMASVKTR